MEPEFKAKIVDLLTAIDTTKEAMYRECKSAFTMAIREAMGNYSHLRKLTWQQYTPKYGDEGTPKQFTAHIAANQIKLELNVSSDDLSYLKKELSLCKNETKRQLLKEKIDLCMGSASIEEIRETILEVLSLFRHEDYLHMFGDHKRVTVTYNGSGEMVIVTNNINHD